MANTPDHHDDYVRGSQDITEQKATFDLVMALTKWGSLHTAAVLLFLVLAFMHGGNLLTAFIAFVALEVVGFFALKSKPAAH